MGDSDDHTGDLARTTSTLPLFNSLLDQTTFIASMGTEGAVDSTYFRNVQNAGDNVRRPSFKPLPHVFMLQMDNSAKDNKNVHVHAFCSELVIRGVFETVEVNFLMVGHTHEDVDALFSKVTAQTINKDVLTLPALMAEIWDSETMHPMPLLLEEVADYKSYVNNFLGPLDENLRGGFWPRTNHGTRFTLAQQHQKTSPDPEDDLIVIDELQQELRAENNMMLQPYVGDLANRPRSAFIPLEDIREGKFVILCPDDAFEAEIPRMIWLGRAMGAVVQKLDDEHHGQFLVEWWRPKHRKSTNATNKERYSNVLTGLKDWEKDLGYFTPQWINVTAAYIPGNTGPKGVFLKALG
ncbi:hypothetical protein R1sor_023658 [Riccia sorocarpa]|uniref:DUF7869 domain-containing protein n=1 Tax=Riccia sorocarpa TaxID=122646 RepID=A0ABD3GNA5_9MARC